MKITDILIPKVSPIQLLEIIEQKNNKLYKSALKHAFDATTHMKEPTK